MRLKSLIVIVGCRSAAAFRRPRRGLAAQTSPIAQPGEPALPPVRHVRRRIEINPRPLLYRRCIDWYELQNRPSGTVLYPQMRCWWVRG